MRLLLRLLLLALFLFELANQRGLLHVGLDYTWTGLTATLGVVVLGIEGIHALLKKTGHPGLHWSVWALAFSSISVDALGDVSHFYSTYPWYDRFAHATGASVTFIIIWNIVRSFFQSKAADLSTKLLFILSYSLAITAGTFYEIEEYLEDVFTGSHRSGGGADTADDLLMNTIGITVIALLIWGARTIWSRTTKAPRQSL